MKYTFFIFYFISSIFGHQMDAGYTYVLPEGFEVINTWEENGVLSTVDEYGNGVDIYIDNVDIDIDIEISLLRQEWADLVIGEEALPNDGHIIRVDSKNIIYPVDTIVIIPKQGFWVKAFFLKLGDPQTHEVFEGEAMNLLRNIARGGDHEKAWINCIRSFDDAFSSI
jgi:hypothetical protein